MSDEALASGRASGRAADLLSAGRALLGVPLGISASSGSWFAVAALLILSWWSDFLDGRLARRSGGRTKLGDWDLAADTTVGAGLLLGLVVGDHVPMLWGLAGGVLGAGFVVLRNPAFGMLLQAMAYGPALWFVGHESLPALALVAVTITVIAVLDASRLFGSVLPAFFGGILGRRERPG